MAQVSDWRTQLKRGDRVNVKDDRGLWIKTISLGTDKKKGVCVVMEDATTKIGYSCWIPLESDRLAPADTPLEVL